MEEFEVKSSERYELINITEKVEQIVQKAGAENGLVLVFTPHSTAGIVLTEDEPGLKDDWLKLLKKIVSGIDFSHNRIDNNADSHILSGLVGQAKILPIENKRLVRGTWQDVFLAEFDGPRVRRIKVMVKT